MPIQLDAPVSASISKSRKTSNNKKTLIAEKSTKIPNQSAKKKVFKVNSTKSPAMANRVTFPESHTRPSSSSPRNRRNRFHPKKIQSKEQRNKKSFKRESKPKMSIEELDAELDAYMNNSK